MSYTISFYFIFFFFFSYINSKRNLIVEEEEELSDDIIILHTNDVHCGVNDVIGYDGLNLYKKELKTKYKHVLLVDAGDNIQGGAIGLLSKGKDIINITNYLEYDVVTIGNHEFDYKAETLFNLSEIIKAGYICCNFLRRKNHSTVFRPYKIKKVGNVSIGFIGVLTPLTLTKSYLHTLVDENGSLIYDFLTERDGHELYEAVQGYIDELRNVEKVDYVIILAHVGYGGDALEQYTSPALLAHINGVDAIIDGHTHLAYNNTFPDKDGKQIYISQTGTKLNIVGKLTIKPNGNITSELIDKIPLFEGYDSDSYYTVEREGIERYVDKETNKFIEDIIESHAHEFQEFVSYTDFDLLITTNRGRIIRFEENILGNLVTDALRFVGNSDISLINAGSIRESIKKGNITFNHVLNTLPFSAKIIVKEVSGRDILDALEFSTKALPKTSSKFLQVSGIKFKVDDSLESKVIVDEFENFVKVDGERRVYDVYIKDKKLDENKKYTISFDDFLAEGGDGFSMFTKYNLTNDTSLVDNEAFKFYLETELNRTIPNKYKTTQGRIVKAKKNSDYYIKYFRKLPLLLLCLLI
jgi:2',3'-cyclic-nucleotide 2'-phosphodiesterase (5'-nucleotidase family)